MNTVTVICTTVNRDTLPRMAHTVLEQLKPGDSLWVIGDGCEPRLPRHPNLRVETREKSKYYGHEHRYAATKEVETSHYTFIDDDDCWLPGRLEKIRAALDHHQSMLIGFVHGQHGYPQTVLLGKDSDRPIPGGWQMWFHKGAQIVDFSSYSDAEMVRQYLERYPVLVRFDLRILLYGPERYE